MCANRRAGRRECLRMEGEAIPSTRKEGEAHCPHCTSSMRTKGWGACGRGGAHKPGVGGGATQAEGTICKQKGGGWRTVHAAPPLRAQRGGGCVGGVGRVNRGWGVVQPGWRGLSANRKEGRVAHCLCCAPTTRAKGWSVCNGAANKGEGKDGERGGIKRGQREGSVQTRRQYL